MTTPVLVEAHTANRCARVMCVALALAAAGTLLGSGSAVAGKHRPFAAREGLACAQSAARSWAQDAALVYLENDEGLGDAGTAPRWGYLFYSPGLRKARGYSVREGRIVVAEDLGVKFEAPPVAGSWIDSEAALAAADAHGGREYCRAHQGRAGTMLLARGAFQQGSPDLTTWTIVYSSPTSASLFVVLDAAQGRICRTWRG